MNVELHSRFSIDVVLTIRVHCSKYNWIFIQKYLCHLSYPVISQMLRDAFNVMSLKQDALKLCFIKDATHTSSAQYCDFYFFFFPKSNAFK